MSIKNKAIGSLVGLAVGDAIGTTVEFKERDTYPVLTDMIGGGAFNLNPGEWTDDTSMALCLAESLISDAFDMDSQLANYYEWYQNGYMSSTGQCFDIGVGTATAIRHWKKTRSTINNDNFMSCGNGSLMRLAPVVIYGSTEEAFTEEYTELLRNIRESSETTHAYETAVDSCVGLGVILNRLFHLEDKHTCLDFHAYPASMYGINDPDIIKVLEGSYLTKKRNEIKSTGYCVDTLEAALWCFHMTSSFKEAVLLAANLGDDADTVAAVTGQLAGAHYGLDGIPVEWVNRIHMSSDIIHMAEELFKISPDGFKKL